MKKRTWLIAALLLFVPTVVLLLLTLAVQPLLPAPWNSTLIVLGVVVAAVLAALSGVMDTLYLADRLSGKKESEALPPVGVESMTVFRERAQAIQNTGSLMTGDVNVNVLAAEAADAFLLRWGGAAAADLRQVTAQYLQTLANRYQYLEFKGMGVVDRVPLRLPLRQMYVPLKARIELPEGETWA
ncbi:MAG: hypothetical protein Fur0021_39060 [Candidatus Promineifilaceae bacterium]